MEGILYLCSGKFSLIKKPLYYVLEDVKENDISGSENRMSDDSAREKNTVLLKIWEKDIMTDTEKAVSVMSELEAVDLHRQGTS